MTQVDLKKLISLLNLWEREADRKGIDTKAINKATERITSTMGQMSENGFGGKNFDQIKT